MVGKGGNPSQSAKLWCQRSGRPQVASVCQTRASRPGGAAAQAHAWTYQLKSGHIRQPGSTRDSSFGLAVPFLTLASI